MNLDVNEFYRTKDDLTYTKIKQERHPVKKNLEEVKMKEMTQEQKQQCNVIIHAAATAAAGVGFTPVPLSEIVALPAIHTTMIIALGRVFDLEIDKSYAKQIAKAALANHLIKLVPCQMFKIIPFVGIGVNGSMVFAITEALGWDVARDFCKKANAQQCA